MGTDIHGIFQRYDEATKTWQDVASEYEQGRHYQLFAVLAGVRNGRGFVGVVTGEPVTPIAELRHYPDDFAVEDDDHPIVSVEVIDPRRQKWRSAEDPLSISMGDHSHSWLSGEEMLAWFENAPEVVKVGILDRKTYEKWDGNGVPESWCGGISGRDAIVINDNVVEKEKTPNWTHITCAWERDLKGELEYFFSEVARLVSEHGRIRFVFGFDS